jgi:LacI family transcriptional regulator
MRQVAELAGVSQVTVTNVLRGRTARTSAETRERVLRAVNELGYSPVAQPASQLRHVETNVIGVTFDQIDALQDDLGLRVLKGLREGAARHGYDLLLMLRPAPDWAPDREEVRFLDRRSDGYIFVAPLERQGVLRALVKHHVPVVSCSSMDVPPGVATVCSDNFDQLRQAVRHLKEAGHRRIVHVAGPPWNFDERLRGESFAPAMEAEGLGRYAAGVIEGFEGRQRVSTEAIFKEVKRRRATAVIGANDGDVLRLWEYAELQGWSVPRDLSLVGINDTPEAAEAGLTSVNMCLAELGIETVEAWVKLQQGASPKSQARIVPVQMTLRNSVTAPGKRGRAEG